MFKFSFHILTQEELYDVFQLHFPNTEKSIPKSVLRKSIEKKFITGVRYKNCTFLFLHHDTSERRQKFSPLLEPLSQENIAGIFIEYFGPEINYNATHMFLLGGLGIGKLWKMLRKLPIWRERMYYAQTIARKVKFSKRPVYVADIADKGLYQIERNLPLILYPILVYLALQLHNIAAYILLGVTLVFFLGYIFNRVSQIFRIWMFDGEKAYYLERFNFDMEDARRFFVALGIRKIALKNISDSSQEKIFVFSVPKAHALRYILYLQTTKNVITAFYAVKECIYRFFLPKLDVFVRQYVYSQKDERWSLAKIIKY